MKTFTLFCAQLQRNSLNIPKRIFFSNKSLCSFRFFISFTIFESSKEIEATPTCPNLCVDRLKTVLNVHLTDPPKGKYQYNVLITFRLRWYEV